MFLKNAAKFYRRTDVKMTLWYILTFSISAFIICSFLYVGLKRQLVKEIDRFLLDETTEMERVLSREPRETDLLIVFEDEVMTRKYYPLFFRILDAKGDLLYVSQRFKELGYGPDDRVLVNARDRKETRVEIRVPGRRRPFRIISTPVFADGRLIYVIQVGTHLHFLRKNLANFKNNILAALPIILVLGSLGGWMLARKSLSPIGYIVSKTQSITSENLSERLVAKGAGDEMDDLIRTINDMIARLESSFKRMAEFTADASHELKTPICAMKGEAEVLLSKDRPASEYHEGLTHLVDRMDYLHRMINDLILLSKFDSSQVELRMINLRLDLLIKDLGDLFQAVAEQKGVNLHVVTTEEVTVSGDKVRLQQLFSNLIDNAVKYTTDGTVHIVVARSPSGAVVVVNDTGMGIPEEERHNIFKRFYRIDRSRSRQTGGTGLGLSIAEQIVRAHGGNIEVRSSPGNGTTFTVTLPASKPQIQSPPG